MRNLRRSLLFVLLLSCGQLAFSQTPPQAPAPLLRLVDDRGQAIAPPLTVCFQVALKNQCADALADGTVPLPPAFTTLRAEGPHYGPLSLRAQDLRPAADGGAPVLRLPRKAFLKIDKLPPDPLTIAVFRARSPAFNKPVLQQAVSPAGVEIPSGDLVVALEARGRAPDLQRLAAPPASRVQLTYQPRDGWSLILRAREAGSGGKPIAGASVALGSRTEATGVDGLALISGLTASALSAAVSHPRYLVRGIEGPEVASGTFTFSEVLLERGGTLRARIALDGQPVTEVVCTFLNPDAPTGGGKLSEGSTGPDSICNSGRLPAGSYVLRVALQYSQTYHDEPIEIRDGVDAEVDVGLISYHVSGRVLVAGRPAVGYTVEAWSGRSKNGAGLPGLRTVTNISGDYAATLVSPGEYVFHVRNVAGALVPVERRVEIGRAEERVDLDLPEQPPYEPPPP